MILTTKINEKTSKYIIKNINLPTEKLIVDKTVKVAIANGHGPYCKDPAVIICRIYKLLDKAKEKQAASLLMDNRSILIDKEEYIRDKALKLYRAIIRRLFFNQHYVLLKTFLELDCGGHDTTLILVGFVSFLLHNYKKALESFTNVFYKSNDYYRKTQASYFISQMQTDNKEREKWLKIATETKTCIWSLLAAMEMNEKIKTISIYEIKPLNFLENPSDNFFAQIQESVLNGDYKKALNYVYAVKRKDWKNFSPTLVKTIKALVMYKKDQSSLHKIGFFIFKNTGIIVEECFPVINELLHLYQNQHISKKEIALCSAIISMESQYMKHSYYNLDNGQALGVMQIAYDTAKMLCQNLGIAYEKKALLNNDVLNIKIGVECLRYHNKLAYNNLVFMIYYYHSGHISTKVKERFHFIDFENLASAVGFSIMFNGNIARDYVNNVMEYYILMHYLIFRKLPNPSEIINWSC